MNYKFSLLDLEIKNISQKQKILEIKENSCVIRYLALPKNFLSTVNIKVRWDNEDIKNNVQYFYPPRFLIVEDNVFGRNHLIDILNKQKLDYLIDIAPLGRDSLDKFKNFLTKG